MAERERTDGTETAARMVAVGTVALDTVETPTESVRDVPGGSAPYFAAAARRYGPVSIAGVVGDDHDPARLLGGLAAAGVDVGGVRSEPGETFRWHVRYDERGGRETISAERGVSARAVPSLLLHHRNPAALFLGSTDPSIQAAVLDEAGSPGLVVLDTMVHWIRERRRDFAGLLRRADVLLLNEEEVRALGRADEEGAAAAAALRSGADWVVVKRGAQGAAVYHAQRDVLPLTVQPLIEAYAASVPTVIDPTGAGDAFAGGFVGVLTEAGGRAALTRSTMERALAEGNRMGGLAVRSFSYDALLVDEEPAEPRPDIMPADGVRG